MSILTIKKSPIDVGDHVVIAGVVKNVFEEPGKPTVYLIDTGMRVHTFCDPEVDLAETQPDAEGYEPDHHSV